MTLAAETGRTPGAAVGTDTILALNNIEVVYDHVILVLKGVSLEVPRGGIVALLGANGAGKTTTLKAISNLLHGEQGALSLSASLCHILLDPGAQEYAANQAREEARRAVDLALDLGSRPAIALFPRRLALGSAIPVEQVVFRVRPYGATAGRIGALCTPRARPAVRPHSAMPEPSLRARNGTSTPRGHVTVLLVVLMSKASCAKCPFAAEGGCTFT